MISESGRSKRAARVSSSASAWPKCRALNRPVFGSTRASASSLGTDSERWMRTSGAIANGTSHGFSSQNVAIPTPSDASTRSVERLCIENRPDSRIECPRASASIGASSEWLIPTSSTHAVNPASANVRCG
jgi:hypothetical protein